MEEHATRVCRSANYYLHRIRKIRDCLNFSNTKLLVHSLVTSRLDYANGLLHNAPISVIKKLDRVQRSSARVVCRLHKYQRISMTEVLHELHWLPVASRIKYKLLIVTFKALRTGTPGYLSDLLVKQKITRRTRSQSIDALIGLLYLCIAESVPRVHPIQSQHLNCGIVYQLTSEAQDH